MKGYTTTLAAGFALMLAATGARAATVTETFNFIDGNRSGITLDYVGVTSAGQLGNVTLQLSGAGYGTPSGTAGEVLNTSVVQRVSQSDGFGLGIDYLGDNDHRLDGFYNEIITFVFNTAVRIEQITFSSVLDNSKFDLYVADGGVLKFVQSAAAATGPVVTQLSDVFAFGASENYLEQGACKKFSRKTGACIKWAYTEIYSGFKIEEVVVSYEKDGPSVSTVPLPAAGSLLLVALLGLGLAKRRRKA